MFEVANVVKGSVRYALGQRAAVHRGWSVLPLGHLNDDSLRTRAMSGGRRESPGDRGVVKTLRFVADVVAPAANENATVAEASVAVVDPSSSASQVENLDLSSTVPDGDLAALGALVCVLSAVGTLAALALLIKAIV